MKRYMMFVSVLLAMTGAVHAQPRADAFFAFDSSQLEVSTMPDLDPFVAWLQENPDGRLVVAGFADERGDSAYNIGLSARRAEVVRDELIAAGAARERIVLALYGEETASRESDAQKRRVTIVPTDEPLHSIIDNRLEDGPAVALLWSEPATVAEMTGPTPSVVGRR